MKIFFQAASTGSLSNINKDLRTYFEKQGFETEIELYKGADVSISNFISQIHYNDYFFKQFKKNILIQPMDGTILLPSAVDIINKFDLIVTPASAGKQFLSDSGITKPIQIIPNYFQTYSLPPKQSDARVVFYHESTLIDRKNFITLLRAFLHTFADTEYVSKVKLVVKSTSAKALIQSEEEIESIKFKYDYIPEIEIINELYTEDQLKQLWANADVYISFAHMEGFGIPLLNFASLGKPIVTMKTSISGYKDFLNENNSYMVDSFRYVTNQKFLIFDSKSEWENISNLDNCKQVIFQSYVDYHNKTSRIVKKDELQKFSYNEVMHRYLTEVNLLFGHETKPMVELPKATLSKKKKFFVSTIKTKGVKYIGSRGTSGYAEAGKNYMLAINQFIPVTWKARVVDNADYLTSAKDQEVFKLNERKINWNNLIIHSVPDTWSDYLNEEGIKTLEDKKDLKIIGQTVWESDRIHPKWVTYCNNELLDEIWVPVEWNKKVFEKCGVTTPIKVVPHIFSKEALPNATIDNVNEDDYVFYTIGNWTPRKGITETIEAFCQAFTSLDKVCLIVKAFAASYSEVEVDKCKYRINTIVAKYSNPPKVIFVGDDCTREQILALHNRGNCYISLCKAEGWGLGAFDAAGYGKPVIITGYGGQVEFFPKGYDLFIDYSLIPVKGMEWIPWYTEDQKWANPSIASAIEKMQQVYINRKKYGQLGEDLKLYVEENYGEKTIQTLIKTLL